MSERRALWVSTRTTTRGGIATYVRGVQQTPLWTEWNIEHVTTHRDGSAVVKMGCFVVGSAMFLCRIMFRRPDVVHIHASSRGSFIRKACLLWLSRVRRIPVVLHIHSGAIDEFYRNSPRPARAVIRATLRNAGVVVALGQHWGARLSDIAPGARIVVLPNAVRIGDVVPQPELGETLRVVFLGRIGEHKGTFELLNAWARFASEHSSASDHILPARLSIAGDGQVEEARRRVTDLNIADTVEVSGWLSAEETAELLDRSHVLVLPSRGEGQPMAVLEAMARGLCVIASDVGGIPEMIAGGCGVLVQPGDAEGLSAALKRVVFDRDLRVRCGEAAHARASENFSIDSVWRGLDDLYRGVVR
jgi:glycosyltransferase involved in cell wall biosynthesis